MNIGGYPKRNVSSVTKFPLVEMEDKITEICEKVYLWITLGGV
jgi:hypothetical protein